MSNFLFSVCTRCENDSHVHIPITCVNSIRNYYPDADIIVVDSDSPIQTHIPLLKDLGCTISDLKNNNYEAGAMWDTFSKYNKKTYVFLQDSMFLQGNIDPFLEKEITVLGGIISGWSWCEPWDIEWIKENITKSDYKLDDIDDRFNIVQYNSLIINKNILDKLVSKNLNKILPTNKIGSCGMERILGIALTLEGYPISDSIQLPQHLIKKEWIRRQ